MNAALLLFFISFPPLAGASEFEELPELVNKKNQHVSGAALKREAAERLTGFLARSYIPTLEAHVGGESFRTGSVAGETQPYGALELKLNLFRGGRDALEESTRQAQSRVARAGFEQTRLQELTQARHSYWALVYYREQVTLIDDALKQNETNLAAGNKRIKAGIATETDRIEFEMYRVQLGQDRARMILGAANSQRALNVLIGRAEGTPLETTQTLPHQHDDVILDAALETQTHRDIQALVAEGEIANSQQQLAYRWWAPSLDLYGSYSLYRFQDRSNTLLADRFEAAAGITLRMNVFDGLQSVASGDSSRLRAEGVRQETAQTARELSANFEGAKQELRLTHDLIHAGEQSVETGAEYLKRTQAEYARGVKNSPDVFSATEKYVNLRRRYAEIRRDYQIAKSDLLAILGK